MYAYKAIKVNGVKIDEHRHVMQVFLGRKLGYNECVHHIDGNKRNNNILNLEIISRSSHVKLHMEKGDIKKVEVKPMAHPSAYAYDKGCRCNECRTFKCLAMRAYRQRKKQILIIN